MNYFIIEQLDLCKMNNSLKIHTTPQTQKKQLCTNTYGLLYGKKQIVFFLYEKKKKKRDSDHDISIV
jgi:hypothetical protein